MMNSTSFHQKIQIEFEFHHSNIISPYISSFKHNFTIILYSNIISKLTQFHSNCNRNEENLRVGGIPTKQTHALTALKSKIEMRLYKEPGLIVL